MNPANPIRRWMRQVLCLLVFSMAGLSMAQDNRALFETANAAYGNGQYQAALQGYTQLWQRGVTQGTVAFNLGNAHYKLGHIAQAILFYERAARLMPGDEDVTVNLALARESIVDQIEARELFFLVKFWRGLIVMIPRGALLGMTVGLYGLFAVAIALLIWLRRRAWLRSLAIGLGLLWAVCALLYWGQWQATHRNDEAVILAESVSVMSAPNEEMAVELFVIHQGLKVNTDQRSNSWVEIILPDGKVGWVNESVLEWVAYRASAGHSQEAGT